MIFTGYSYRNFPAITQKLFQIFSMEFFGGTFEIYSWISSSDFSRYTTPSGITPVMHQRISESSRNSSRDSSCDICNDISRNFFQSSSKKINQTLFQKFFQLLFLMIFSYRVLQVFLHECFLFFSWNPLQISPTILPVITS